MKNVELISRLLSDENTYATTILAILVDKYSLPELVEWDPQTLELQVKDDYKIDLPEASRDKLWALITAISTNLFYTSPETFMHICAALSGSEPSFEVFDLPSPEDLAWGIVEVLLNDSEKVLPAPTEFSPEVRRFIGFVLGAHNIDQPPDVLAIADYETVPMDRLSQNTDDPEIFTAVWQKEQQAAEEIQSNITSKLQELMTQLNVLPLENRDKEAWNSFFEKATKVLRM